MVEISRFSLFIYFCIYPWISFFEIRVACFVTIIYTLSMIFDLVRYIVHNLHW